MDGGPYGLSRYTVRTSGNTADLAAALAKAQGELRNPVKDSVNPHFRSRYADLATVRDAVFPVLSAHGLSVVQLPTETPDGPALTTLLLHSSGQWIETTGLLRPIKADPQGVGSALTYSRRYALQSIVGVAADDDDDGEQASRTPASRAKPKGEPAIEPEKLTPGDPLTDGAAFAALLNSRGFEWSAFIADLNERHGSSYSPLHSRWREIPREIREKCLAFAQAAAEATPDGLAELCAKIAKLEGVAVGTVCERLNKALGWNVGDWSELTSEQVRAGLAACRRKLKVIA